MKTEERVLKYMEQNGSIDQQRANRDLYRPDKDMWYMAPTPEYPWGASFSPNEIKEIREEKKA